LSVAPCHNAANPWQGEFRTGWFDAVTAQYALEVVGGVDILGITNLDRLESQPSLQATYAYEATDQLRDGRIPMVSGDLDTLRVRTAELAQAVPQYAPMPPLSEGQDGAVVRHADALGELMSRRVDLISTHAGARKTYRSAAAAKA
jgi:adenylosuccinate synthase